MTTKRESVLVLEECIDLQKRKSRDYQNPNSNIVQAMHYRRGVSTIHDMIHQKLLRAQSLLEAAEQNGEVSANFESLEDTYKDMINYCSFAVSYLRGQMEGQATDRDIFNKKTALSRVADAVPSKQLLVEDVGDRIEADMTAASNPAPSDIIDFGIYGSYNRTDFENAVDRVTHRTRFPGNSI